MLLLLFLCYHIYHGAWYILKISSISVFLPLGEKKRWRWLYTFRLIHTAKADSREGLTSRDQPSIAFFEMRVTYLRLIIQMEEIIYSLRNFHETLKLDFWLTLDAFCLPSVGSYSVLRCLACRKLWFNFRKERTSNVAGHFQLLVMPATSWDCYYKSSMHDKVSARIYDEEIKKWMLNILWSD